MRIAILGIGAAAIVAGLLASRAVSEEPANGAEHQHLRVSTLEGINVRNQAGDDLGKIKDVVVDLNSGTIRYLALDFGGLFGFGDKLFAVPWNAFKYHHVGNDRHMMLNIAKESFRNAPGFDKNHWPDMADPQWSSDVDTYYGPLTSRGAVPQTRTQAKAVR